VPARDGDSLEPRGRLFNIAQGAGLPSIPHSCQKGRVLACDGMTGREGFTTPRFEIMDGIMDEMEMR
jgi:hypothetical protein